LSKRLEFPRPEGFVQSLRQRVRGLGTDVPLLVVEGDDDLRAIFPFLAGTATVVPAGGRTNALAAFQQLEARFRAGVVFVVDCDGQLGDSFKGHHDLVITTNRDIEADLLLELRAFVRVAAEYLSQEVADPSELATLTESLLSTAADLALHLGVLQGSAAGLGLRVRPRGRSANSRRIRVFDLPSATVMASGSPPNLDSLATDLAALTGWSPAQKQAVVERAEELLRESCAHGPTCCPDCLRQRHANGHHLVDCVTAVLATRSATAISSSEIARAIRIGADRSLLGDWEVTNRLRQWQEGSGLVLLSN
jgi:hypothetical protein